MLCSSCSEPIRPVVSIDIDGTIGEYHDHFARFVSNYYDIAPPTFPYDGSCEFEDHLGLTKIQYREAKLAYRQGGMKRSMPLLRGAKQFVEAIAERAEVWIATTRPWQRLDNIDPDTREWLRRNAIPFDGLLYGDDKYHQLVQHIEIDRIIACIEDLPEQVVIARDFGLPICVVARPHNGPESFSYRGLRADYPVLRTFILQDIDEWEQKHVHI